MSAPPPGMLLVKAIFLPSADHVGSQLFPCASLSLVWPNPSEFILKTWNLLAAVVSWLLTKAMAPLLPGRDVVPTLSADATGASTSAASRTARIVVVVVRWLCL